MLAAIPLLLPFFGLQRLPQLAGYLHCAAGEEMQAVGGSMLSSPRSIKGTPALMKNPNGRFQESRALTGSSYEGTDTKDAPQCTEGSQNCLRRQMNQSPAASPVPGAVHAWMALVVLPCTACDAGLKDQGSELAGKGNRMRITKKRPS